VQISEPSETHMGDGDKDDQDEEQSDTEEDMVVCHVFQRL